MRVTGVVLIAGPNANCCHQGAPDEQGQELKPSF